MKKQPGIKLTKSIVNERLAGRGLELVGEYTNNATKTLFRCPEGHEWHRRIRRGR